MSGLLRSTFHQLQGSAAFFFQFSEHGVWVLLFPGHGEQTCRKVTHKLGISCNTDPVY
jgi:hypothetical protein